jgi:hypothetical protein
MANAQSPQENSQVTQEAIEKQLAKGLTPEAKKLLQSAIRGNQAQHTQRLRFKLPENSEPCTVYIPSGAEAID